MIASALPSHSLPYLSLSLSRITPHFNIIYQFSIAKYLFFSSLQFDDFILINYSLLPSLLAHSLACLLLFMGEGRGTCKYQYRLLWLGYVLKISLIMSSFSTLTHTSLGHCLTTITLGI
jgi:hypothetical protein